MRKAKEGLFAAAEKEPESKLSQAEEATHKLAPESQPQHITAAPHTAAARREAAADPPQHRHGHPLRRLPDPSSTPPDPRTHL